jgi:hypothetical protein
LLQLAADAGAAGIEPDDVLILLRAVGSAADAVAGAVLDALGHLTPRDDPSPVEALVGRGRGLLSHGLGRLTLHRLGRAAGVSDGDDTRQVIARLSMPPAAQPRGAEQP